MVQMVWKRQWGPRAELPVDQHQHQLTTHIPTLRSPLSISPSAAPTEFGPASGSVFFVYFLFSKPEGGTP